MENEIEIYLTIDEDGDFAVGSDYDDSIKKYAEEIGGESRKRTVVLKVQYDFPPIEEIVVKLSLN